jgi:hypothetical protein
VPQAGGKRHATSNGTADALRFLVAGNFRGCIRSTYAGSIEPMHILWRPGGAPRLSTETVWVSCLIRNSLPRGGACLGHFLGAPASGTGARVAGWSRTQRGDRERP